MRYLAIIAFVLVAGCTTQQYTPPPADGEQAEIYMEYGAGGDALSAMLGPGQGTLGQQITNKFPQVRIAGYYDWTDYSVLSAAAAVPSNKSIIFIGDSCGGSIGSFLAAALQRKVLAVMGIQPSDYCPTIGSTDPVPSNVAYALETYNPNCFETFFLGCRVYTAGASTKLTIVQRPDLHPALTQDSFNDVLDELSMIFAPQAKFGGALGSKMVVRYHGQRMLQ